MRGTLGLGDLLRAGLVGMALSLASPDVRSAAYDPELTWRTLKTAHFNITFHGGEERLAEEVAVAAERAWEILTAELGTKPKRSIEIVLVDNTDSANGYAMTVPINTIVIYVTAPEEDSTLALYANWNEAIIIHELTHILHIDMVEGLPRAVRAVFGRIISVNRVSPGWIVEGQATFQETRHTTGGRGRSNVADMLKRAAVLEGASPPLGNMDGYQTSPPGGNLRYIFGQDFQQYIADTRGEMVWTDWMHVYGSWVPWLLPSRRVFGDTFPTMYAEWKAHLEERYARQKARVEAEGLTPFELLSDGVDYCAGPTWNPQGDKIVWACSDPKTGSGVWVATPPEGGPETWEADPAGWKGAAWKAERELQNKYARDFTWRPDGTAFAYSSLHVVNRFNSWSDVYFHVLGGKDESMTRGARARTPEFSPDGRELLAVTNGLQQTRLARLTVDRQLETLTEFDDDTQISTPRYSPDGKSIAVSLWQDGQRDIWLLDADGALRRRVTADLATDIDPAWSADGRWLYFSSDRSGIFNIYAVDLQTERLWQVTNLLGGAFHPAPRPDGTALVFESFSNNGPDIAWMPMDPSAWRDRGLLPLPLDSRAPLVPTADAGGWQAVQLSVGPHAQAPPPVEPAPPPVEPAPATETAAAWVSAPTALPAPSAAAEPTVVVRPDPWGVAAAPGDEDTDETDGEDEDRDEKDDEKDDEPAPAPTDPWGRMSGEDALRSGLFDADSMPGLTGLGGPFYSLARLPGPWGMPGADQPTADLDRDDPTKVDELIPEEEDYPFTHPVRRYDPIPSLLPPRYLSPTIYSTTFGFMGVLATGGTDVLRRYYYSGYASYRTDANFVGWGASAALNRWIPVFTGGAYRYVAPYGDIYVATQPDPGSASWLPSIESANVRYWDKRTRGYAQVSYPLDEYRSVFGRWSGTYRAPLDPIGPDVYRSWLPTRGFISSVGGGWRYSRGRSYSKSISPEDARVVAVVGELVSPWLGAYVLDDDDAPVGFTQVQVTGEWREYQTVPWAANHVAAIKAAAGATAGDQQRYGSYRLGGDFGESAYYTLPDEWRALRGFKPATVSGEWFYLGSLEYRLPLFWLDRGVSTIPFFGRYLSATAFIDAGNAFNDFADGSVFADTLVGTGAELRGSAVLGWGYLVNVRLGYGFALHGEGGIPLGSTEGFYAWIGSSF